MTDIAVIILVGQEEIHIGRCLKMLAPLEARQIFVVESQKGDRTHEIAKSMGATTAWHDWPGNQAEQFNWALENLSIESAWVLRLDADEYLLPETIDKLKVHLANVDSEICGFRLELRHRFLGGEIRHATNGIRMVRLFRRGRGRYAKTLMDERLVIDGAVEDFLGAFYDDNLNSLEWWKEKHRNYARREAMQALCGGSQDPRKKMYYRLPPYIRAFVYFCARYFLKGGFLDGKAGWQWNFWQALWYRMLVDSKIIALKKQTRREI